MTFRTPGARDEVVCARCGQPITPADVVLSAQGNPLCRGCYGMAQARSADERAMEERRNNPIGALLALPSPALLGIVIVVVPVVVLVAITLFDGCA